MTLPKSLVEPDFNYTYPSERPYLDETGSTLAVGRVADPSKSGVDYGITDPAVAAPIIPVTGISILPASATLTTLGGTQALTPTFSPTDASIKAISWTSSNLSVATVNSAGVVTAVANGTATITATTVDGGFTDTTAITVNIV